MAILELLILLVAAAGIGRSILIALRTVPEDRTERLVMSAAVGLGLVAYLVLAVGLVGLLQPGPVLAVLAIVVIASWRGFTRLVSDMRPPRVVPMASDNSVGEAPADVLVGESRWLRRLCLLVLTVIGVIAVANCFLPPGSHEWDAIAYHLAAPKVYLQHHRIIFLPTDHHSNFPFLVEMLFTLGLMLNGFALANLFHFALGALTVAAIVAIGRRHFALNAGWIAALAFASTPIVIWEAGAAYIEHGMALYVLLSIGAALECRRTADPRWLGLSGILMGFALGTKALALVPAFALPALLLVDRYRFKQLRWYLLGAIVVGCPFYVKTWVLTGDPVYPFGYKIFHGRYWSEDLASTYAGSQKAFGLQRSVVTAEDDWRNLQPVAEPHRPQDRLRNAMMAPFALVSVPRIFYDYTDPGPFNHLGFLFLALPMLLLVAAGRSQISKASALTGGVVLLWYLVWSQTMQYVRYLVPMLPLLLLIGGEGVVHAARKWKLIGALAAVVFAQQIWVSLHFFGVDAPRRAATISEPDRRDQYADSLITSYGRLFQIMKAPEARDNYLKRAVNHYAATEWLNKNASKDAGVILFEEPRGFYLDRPYLWGNYFHSLFIPYATFATGREMADWFLGHGYRYALVNLQFSPIANDSDVNRRNENMQKMKDAIGQGSAAGLMLEWYGPNAPGGERWRTLLGEAIREGGAVVINDASQRGVVVLEFRPSRPGISGDAMEAQAGGGRR